MSETSFKENLINIHIITVAKIMQTNIRAEATVLNAEHNVQKHYQCRFIPEVVILLTLKPNSPNFHTETKFSNSTCVSTTFLPVDGNRELIQNALV